MNIHQEILAKSEQNGHVCISILRMLLIPLV